MKTLFLAWQAPEKSLQPRSWYPVGRLDAEVDRSAFRFGYTRGALKARDEAGFVPLFAFPDLQADYESNKLFPLFQNRVLSEKRPEFKEYLKWLDLDREPADPISILTVSGGERVTDNLEVFPKMETAEDGSFHLRFFLHGLRHLTQISIDRALKLVENDALRVSVELNNPVTRLAVTLMTDDYQMIGWTPRYLVEDLIQCMPRSPDLTARVARINSDSAPLNQRILIELTGKAPDGIQLMSTPDFQLVNG